MKDCLLSGEAAYTCPVSYELFLGALPHERADLATGLGLALRIDDGPGHWDRAATLGSELRAQGQNLPALDLLIATVAATEDIPLLTTDTHFTTIRDFLPSLRLP